jgi:hypothetical protein
VHVASLASDPDNPTSGQPCGPDNTCQRAGSKLSPRFALRNPPCLTDFLQPFFLQLTIAGMPGSSMAPLALQGEFQ